MPPTILIGADPELFIVKDDQVISAHDIIPGTKEKPYPVPGGSIQVDGLAAELNINPSLTAEEFDNNCTQVLNSLLEIINLQIPNAKLVNHTVATFKKDYFDSLPNSIKILGCDPDFNAYSQQANINPKEKFENYEKNNSPIRVAGGHIHIGYISENSNYWDNVTEIEHFAECCLLIKDLEEIFTYCKKSLHHRLRSRFYGQRGSFRPKKYGVEWRSPTPFWVLNSEYRKLFFNSIQKRCKHILKLIDEKGNIKPEKTAPFLYFNRSEEELSLNKKINYDEISL